MALLAWIVCVLFLLSKHLNISEEGVDITKKDIKLSSKQERWIHDYYEENKKEVDFWIYDVFHLADNRAFLLNTQSFKKIQYKVGKEREDDEEKAYVYFLNVKKDLEEPVKYRIHQEDFFFQEIIATEPSEWKIFFPKDEWVKDEIRRFFKREKINNFRYIGGRKSQIIGCLQTVGKYYHWLKPEFMMNERSYFNQSPVPSEFIFLTIPESLLNPVARSEAGAVGLWQFLLGTSKRYGLEFNEYIDERCDIFQSTKAAYAHFDDLFSLLSDWRLALTGYIVGERNIFRALERSAGIRGNYNNYFERELRIARKQKNRQVKSFFDYHKIRNPDFKEIYSSLRQYYFNKRYFSTTQYVNLFVAFYLISNHPNAFGFHNLRYQPPVPYKRVKVRGDLLLNEIAKNFGVDQDMLCEMNAQLRKKKTPPGFYTLKIPVEGN